MYLTPYDLWTFKPAAAALIDAELLAGTKLSLFIVADGYVKKNKFCQASRDITITSQLEAAEPTDKRTGGRERLIDS